MEPKKEIIRYFLEKGILISKELAQKLSQEDLKTLKEKINGKNMLLLDNEVMEMLKRDPGAEMDWQGVEKLKAGLEKKKNLGAYKEALSSIKTAEKNPENSQGVEITVSHQTVPRKIEVQDFVKHLNNRYEAIRNLLLGRQELKNSTSINKLFMKKEKDTVSIIGLVTEKRLSKNGNWMFTIEDPTGTIKTIINKNKPEQFETATNTCLDEVVGVVGVFSKDIIFGNSIFYPDVPLTKELKKSPDQTYAIFISDLHFGLNVFLQENLERFIKWIRGEIGNDGQKAISSKIKYLFIIGDLVEGVGIYPGQENDLKIKDIYAQYEALSVFLKQIPSSISIIICPGNHDAMRIAEPQPPLYMDFAKPLYEMKNVHMVSNPSCINIHKSKGFPGFDVLMYHGFSFTYYGDNVESIRLQGGMERPDLIMRFLLQRRHLAPTHTSTLYIPDTGKDPLVIDKVPDFFVSGHIHRTAVANYRNVTIINSSCWVSQTDYQEKVGLKPQPARVPIVDLQTREAKILKF
ncbi:DNA-directed DNA polymerase II small subunit [Candidatus Woesearchaeota archaeon]|nr:DNA-directed DNA polymerase II small subunit [Candidatus Woesearchaeota archaeon]